MANKPVLKDIITFRDGNKVGTLVLTCKGFDGAEQYGVRVKLINGRHGPFVSFPSQKDREGKYVPQFFNTDRERRDKFNAQVVRLFGAEEDKPEFDDFSDVF